MRNKKVLVMSTLLIAVVLLSIGTIAYFRRIVSGNITGQTGNLVLVVNEKNSVNSETFDVTLQRSQDESFILPDDSGGFNLNINSNGSTDDVAITILIERTNLPDNLKFYLDSNHTQEIESNSFIIKKSNDMTLTIPIYWYWNGSVDDENDSEFINKTISATISVSATTTDTLYDTLINQNYTIDTNVDFSQLPSSTNGQGLMMLNTSQTQEYPIYYYRGDVSNNNVVFGGYCWLIVRTTETGGIKLIYNGRKNADGSCTNFSGVGGQKANTTPKNVFIDQKRSAFNTSYDSPVYAGYMYNDTNKFFTHSEGWDGSTREDADGTLDVTGYREHLDDNTIDSSAGRHTQNLKNSTIKEVIDEWYEVNFKGSFYEKLLEDTIWCNNRDITDSNSIPENYITNNVFRFDTYTRLFGNNTISLTCARDVDKFTVNRTNGNGDLDYPIALLTADEFMLSGIILTNNNAALYLRTSYELYWGLSPLGFDTGKTGVFRTVAGGLGGVIVDYSSMGVRPAISLNNNTYVVSGNGSFESPYIVG